MKYLSENYDLSQADLVGASAGGLVSTLAACGVDTDAAVKAAYRISVENNVVSRPGGLAGIWGGLVRQWLDELLPANAAELCHGRVRLIATEVPSLRLCYLSDFESKEDLIEANMASVHIPVRKLAGRVCSCRCCCCCPSTPPRLQPNCRPRLPASPVPAHTSHQFFLDGNPSSTYRGRTYIDGSVWDFLKGSNSHLITCDGLACVVDYVSGGGVV